MAADSVVINFRHFYTLFTIFALSIMEACMSGFAAKTSFTLNFFFFFGGGEAD